MNGNNLSKDAGRHNLVDFIKSIGHQHSLLVEITDHINNCYAFQVFFLDLMWFIEIDVIIPYFFANQMIFNTAFVFWRMVFILFAINQYIVHQSDEMKIRLLHYLGWISFRLVQVLIPIYNAGLITQEVKLIL